MSNFIINYIKKVAYIKQPKLPKIINKSIHNIQHKDISFATKKVILQLNKNNFEAYIVGGAVRDMINAVKPKDFDIVTNAYPEQIKKIFNFAQIIGKRFKIVHVHINNEIVEVSTFRSFDDKFINENGKILKDNEYGNITQDAFRRDFTCNALYYDFQKEIIIDFHNAIDDIKIKKLLVIGNVNTRFKEDPIRILRAIRFSAKLDFNINEHTLKSMITFAHLISLEPKARLFDELLKIFKCGKSLKCIQIIKNIGIQSDIHPILNFSNETSFIYTALKESDNRIQNNNHISIGFIIAALIWEEININWKQKIQNGQKLVVALNDVINEFKISSNKLIAIPKNIISVAFEIIRLQAHLSVIKKNKPLKTLKNPKFKLAYDFLAIRTTTNELSNDLFNWWSNFSNADKELKNKMIGNKIKNNKKKLYSNSYN